MNKSVAWRVLALLLGICLCLDASAAEGAAKKAAPKAKASASALPTIIWRGDRATARAFVRELAKNYETAKLGKVELQPFNTISGLDAVIEGSADIAGSARPPAPSRAEEKQLTFYPVLWDALVPITSPKNPVGNVTLKQLYEIYLGHVTNWKELGGEDAPINLYAVASPTDGIEYSLRNLLYHDGEQRVSVPRLYVNIEKLEEGIAIDPHAIGISLWASVHGNPALKAISVEGLSASQATITDGSYPLYTLLFLVAREDGKNVANVQKFVQYTSSDPVKALMRQHGLVPYADAPNLVANENTRVAFIDGHLGTLAVVAATTAATPVSAPVATADYLIRTAPNAPATQEAKDRAARVQLEKAAAKPETTPAH
ncbi:MAG TPA: substrate-binding domain-containing protein [Rudaea sp.]|nr:substrate-binding domain-containing protein [Rudaea sp.]HSC11781.1 substrate-binding domain-containing protein [Rhodanobacteraceae bacterium]